MSGAGELVGDGAGVAGHVRRVVVDLVEEEPQGLGDGGGAGLVEGDGDRGCGAGDGSGEAADDGLAGDGAVFVVVAQVGVEVAGQPVLGVVREEPQDHLQGPAAGAQQGALGFGVDLVGGEPGGDLIEGGFCPGELVFGCGDFLLGGGDQPGVLVRGGDGGVAEQRGEAGPGAAEGGFSGAGGVPGSLAGRVINDLGVGLDGGGVVADLVDSVVRGRIFEEVLLAPPGLEPVQDVGGAGIKVGGEGRAAVGDPVDVLVAAVAEHLRVGAAPVESEHDLRAGAGGPLQLGQGQGQGHGQAGRLAGDKAHGPAVGGGDVGVGVSFLGPAPLVVPALPDRLGPRIGDEVVIDVVDAGQRRGGGEHRGGERGLQRGRVGRPGD